MDLVFSLISGFYLILEGWKLVYILLFYLFCYIKHIGPGIWRLMPRHLNCLHLLLKAAWTTAQRRDISTRQKPPTHSCLLALAFCLLWQWAQITRSKSDSDWAAVISSTRDRVLPHQNYLWAKSSDCQSVCNRGSKGLCSLSPLPSYFTGMHSAQARSRNWWNSKLKPLPWPSSVESQRSKVRVLLTWQHMWATVLPSHQGYRFWLPTAPRQCWKEGNRMPVAEV